MAKYTTENIHAVALVGHGGAGKTMLAEALLWKAGVIGTMGSTVDVSYLADSVVLLRYFESEGEVRKAISVLKKRTGFHEPSIRELRLRAGEGVSVSEPLRQFRGVLTGVPFDEPNRLGA